MAVDTSSSAAATTAVVWLAAAELAALSVELIPAKSDATATIVSGSAIKNDIVIPLCQ